MMLDDKTIVNSKSSLNVIDRFYNFNQMTYNETNFIIG